MRNHSVESYFTICHSDSLPSKVSVTMKKNKLFKQENNQSTKQVSIVVYVIEAKEIILNLFIFFTKRF